MASLQTKVRASGSRLRTRVSRGRGGGGNGSTKPDRVLDEHMPVLTYSATGKVTKATFVKFLTEQCALHESLAKVVWEQMCGFISTSLRKGRTVCLTNIGTLEAYRKKPTTYRHPVTGEVRKAKGCKHVRFHPALKLKEELRA